MSPDLFQFILILGITLVTSAATLLTGFGVGTVLTPTFALFYDVKTAVLLVSVVHLANNLLKFGLFRRHVSVPVLRRFGFISILGALVGSLLQGSLHSQYVAMVLGLFLVVAGSLEFLPAKSTFKIPRSADFFGGFFSGFMGGIIGNQGAIRSAYLLNYDLSKESFIATATTIAIIIDLTRIPVYLSHESTQLGQTGLNLLAVTLVAFGGTFLGKRLLQKIPLTRFRLIVAAFLVVMGARFLLFS